MQTQPFTINIPQSTLDDLHDRLARTRWPDAVEEAGWAYGVDPAYMRELADYWQHRYDWRQQEAKLNQFHHFKATVDGVNIHFIHERGEGASPIPLILTHGWPDSFYRFHKVIPMLTNPTRYGGKAEEAFDVIVPSVPGFGFSDRRAMSEAQVAALWAKLMTDVLGYECFAAAGGDVGSGVTKALAANYPALTTAIHLTDVGYPTGQEDFATMSAAEQEFASFIQQWWFMEGAYAMMQATKPQTIAYGLNDSPLGLAAWIVSFVNTGALAHQIEAAFGSRDELLTNIMIYWVTQTAGSAARMYLETARAAYGQAAGMPSPQRSKAPSAVALFPREAQFSREWAERSLNVQRFTKMAHGGHFAALETPDLLVADLRAFFHSLR